MTRKFTKICVLLLCSLFALATFAQNSNSTITGTVQDASGAVVPGATINLTNVGTSQQLSTTARGDGFYTFTNLSPANYRVSVTAAGFAQWVGVLTLRVSQSASVDPKLTAASVTTQVTVRDVTPVIDRVNPTISDVKNANTIETIPDQGRSILSVLAFSPGVVANNYGGAGAGYTRVNGVPGGSMDYLVDGQTMTNKFTNELQGNPQPTPTFQEVKIITSNGDAQYGRPGIVELVTKSGTNNFHGQLFELNRNTILTAKNAFSGPTIPYLMRNEFGGQLGGPVWLPKIYNGRNKTFFFLDLEGIRQDSNASPQYFVPTAAMRGGNLAGITDAGGGPLAIYNPTTTSPAGPPFSRAAFGGNQIPSAQLNPIVQKILSPTFNPGNHVGTPLPNIDVPANQISSTPNYIPTNAAQTLRNKLYTAKVDQLFGPNRLAMRYTYTSSTTLTPSKYFINDPTIGASGGHNGAIVFTQVIGSHAVNVVRAGVQYNHQFSGPQAIPGIPEALGLPTYKDLNSWPGFSYSYGNDYYWTGIDRNNPKDYPNSLITASDQFSYNRGNHQFMFGFEVDNSRLSTFEVGQPGGGYTYDGNFSALQDPAAAAKGTFDSPIAGTGAGLADFLLGDTHAVNLNIYPHYHTRQTEYDGYAQDNWRVTQNLTLNLGLRYSFWTPFTDSSGLMSTLNLSTPGGVVVYQGKGPLPAQTSAAVLAGYQKAGMVLESAAQAGYPSKIFSMAKNNFQPRLGFAYQLSSRTVLRGGWGIYNWVMPLQQFEQSIRKNAPFYYNYQIAPSQLASGVIPDSTAAELEFPYATTQYGGACGATNPNCPSVNAFMLGNSHLAVNDNQLQISQGSGFTFVPMDTNYKPDRVQEYNLTLSQELPAHVGFQLSYIGNHSTNLLQFNAVNAAIPRVFCSTPGCNAQQRRAFAAYSTSGANSNGGGMDEYRYDGYSNTNELQAQVQRTFGNGLLVQSSFTWQRTLTTTEDGLLGTAGLDVIPAALTPGYTLSNYQSGVSYSRRQRAVYAPDSNLPNKTFSLNAHYEFPFGRGKRYLGNSHGVVNALVSGYNISPFFQWHSGFYFAPYYSAFNSNTVLAPGKTGILPEGQRNRQHWFDASLYRADLFATGAITAPYAGQAYIREPSIQANGYLGDFRNNIPRNYMTGPGFNNLDATIYKLTPLGKGTVLDIEAQIFNVYNHQNLALPTNSWTGKIIAPLSQGAGSTGSGPVPRTIQLQAKFIF